MHLFIYCQFQDSVLSWGDMLRMANLIGGIVGLVLGIVLIANLYMTTVHGTNTSTWSTSEIALWSVVGLIGIIGIVYGALNVFGVV